MAQYYLRDNGAISTKKKEDKKSKSQLDYNKQVSEKIKEQRSLKEQVSRPIDYASTDTNTLRQQRDALRKQMLNYGGTTNSKGKYTLKGIFEAMSGQTRKKLDKDKTYQTAQDRLNEMNSILEQRFNETPEAKTLPMQLATNLEQKVIQPVNTTTEELSKDPVQTLKTTGVGLVEGVKGSKKAIQNSLLDLGKALAGDNQLYNNWYTKQKIEQNFMDINDPLKKTKTYKKLEEGKLGEGQQVAYNLASNIGAMGPAIATTALTGSPTAGSAVFYAQAQDNYYNEALQRGYDEKEARMYGLAMAGVETIVERLGFDEIGGLPEGSITKAMLGEGAEEFVTPYIDAAIRKLGFKENVKMQDVNKEAIEGALMGAATGGIMQLAGNGFAKVDILVDKINNGETVSPTDIQGAIEEVQQADPNFMDNMLTEAVDNLDDNTIEQIKQEMKLEQPTTEKVITQPVQDANIQENAPTEKQTVAVQEQPEIKLSTEKKKEGQLQFNFDETNNYKTLAKENNYSKENINLAERIQDDVISIAKDKKDAEQLSVMTSPPAKKQRTTTISTPDGNTTKHYNPSQSLASEGEHAMYENIRNRVNSSLEKQINMQNTKTNKTILDTISRLRSEGNDILANALEEDLNDYTYTVENMGDKANKNYHNLLINLASGETDVETVYKNIRDEYDNLIESGEWNEIDSSTGNAQKRLEWEYKANALNKILKMDKTGSYNYIVREIEYIMDSIGHTAGQDLAMMSAEARKNPNNLDRFAENRLINMYEKELKHHSKDAVWQNENNPYDLTNNSPYRFSDEEFDTLTTLTSQLKEIDQYKDNESFQRKLNEIDNFVGEAMTKRLRGIRGVGYTAKNALVNLIKQNNLLSIRVGLTNIASNVMDTFGLNKPRNLITNLSEKALSKITGFKTTQYTKQGKSIYKKGLMEGLQGVGKEFMIGVKVSDLNTKYSINGDVDYSKIGNLNYKTRAKSKIGKILTAPINAEGRLVTGWLSLGDTPKSTAVRNESLFNQLNQEAIRQSIASGKDSIFYTLDNEKAGNTTFYYSDSDGKTRSKTVKLSEKEAFLPDRNQIEADETMLDIAREDGERAVYTNHNSLNDKARKWVDALNSTVPGLGDLTLQFTNVANNMAVETYRHSPLAVPELINKTKTLQKNSIYIENKIDSYLGEGKDFTTTKEYKKLMKQNYSLQHDLGQAYGKVLAGTVVSSLMILAKAANIATGDVDKDDEDKGIQDYSIKIGDKYYSYDFGVFGMVAKSGSVIYDAFQGDENLLSSSFSAMKGYGESIMEQSFIQNLIDTFMTKYGDSWEDKIADLQINLASSLTTPGFVKEINLARDDFTSRSTYSNDKWEYLANRLKANWNREDLPKKFDGWGNTMKKGSTMIDSAWNTFFKTNFMSTRKDDKVDDELADVYQTTGDHEVLPLKTTGTYKNNVNSFSYKKEKYVLNDKEKEKFSETYGKSAYNNMKKLFDSSMYKQADYNTKVKYIKEVYENARDVAKAEFLKGRGVEYYNAGQQVWIKGENNRFENSPTVNAINKGISYQSAKGEINNPEKYKYATTIVKDYDIYSSAQTQLQQIKDVYSDTDDRKNAYIDYVNSCSRLSAIEKAMLIKTEYSSLYKKYDNQIKEYLKSKKLSEEEYQYALKQMGIKEKNK